MATQRVSILNHATIPDDSGKVYFQPYSNNATNDTWKHLICTFIDSTTRNGLYGQFNVPVDYAGTSAYIIVVWTSDTTSGSVEWDFDYRAVSGNDTESLDQATAQETVNGADVAPSATDERLEFSLTLTHGNMVAEDTVTFTLFRDGTDAGDTMVGDAYLFDLLLEYDT